MLNRSNDLCRSRLGPLYRPLAQLGPGFGDPGYRAFVEENVKESVCNTPSDPAMQAARLFLLSCPQPPGLTRPSQLTTLNRGQ